MKGQEQRYVDLMVDCIFKCFYVHHICYWNMTVGYVTQLIWDCLIFFFLLLLEDILHIYINLIFLKELKENLKTYFKMILKKNLNVNTGTGTQGLVHFASHFFCEMTVGRDDCSSFFPAVKYYDWYHLFVSNHVLKSFL